MIDKDGVSHGKGWFQMPTHGGTKVKPPIGKRGVVNEEWASEAMRNVDSFTKAGNKADIGKLKSALKAIGVLAFVGAVMTLYDFMSDCKECDANKAIDAARNFKNPSSTRTELEVKLIIAEYLSCVFKSYPAIEHLAQLKLIGTDM